MVTAVYTTFTLDAEITIVFQENLSPPHPNYQSTIA